MYELELWIESYGQKKIRVFSGILQGPICGENRKWRDSGAKQGKCRASVQNAEIQIWIEYFCHRGASQPETLTSGARALTRRREAAVAHTVSDRWGQASRVVKGRKMGAASDVIRTWDLLGCGSCALPLGCALVCE